MSDSSKDDKIDSHLLPNFDLKAFEAHMADVSLKEDIYMIESPSPEDLFKARNEGDALARTLSLAEVNVVYYLAVGADNFQSALDDIVIRINNSDNGVQMPFIHISAHGYEDGLELTDGDTLYWEQLSKKLTDVTDLVGRIEHESPVLNGIPRINLSLSSCNAYTNFLPHMKSSKCVQSLVGPDQTVGWCQALIGFTTFFYQSFICRKSFYEALEIMNYAVSGPEAGIFKITSCFDRDKIKGPVLKSVIDHFKNAGAHL